LKDTDYIFDEKSIWRLLGGCGGRYQHRHLLKGGERERGRVNHTLGITQNALLKG
jgi:hypothetical protein